jgi:EpsI family protein
MPRADNALLSDRANFGQQAAPTSDATRDEHMAVVADESPRMFAGRRLQTSAWVYATVLLAAIVLWPTLAALVRIWGEMADYNHGYIVAVVVVIWLGGLRRQLDSRPAQTSWLGIGALAVSLALWLVAYRGNSELLQQLLLPIVMLFAVAACVGMRSAALIAAPLAYLYFAIPIWEYAVPLLQKLTTVAAEAALGVLGVPASFAGPEVTLPSGQFIITEDCAGKRYLLVALASAALMGVVQRLAARRMLVLLAGAATLSMLANWLRVSIIIYVGHITDMQHYLVAVEHVTFGWLVFLPLLAAIYLLSWRLSAGTVIAPSGVDLVRSARDSGATMVRVNAALLLLLTLFAAVGGSTSAVGHSALDAMPILTGEWQGPFPSNGWRAQFHEPHDQRQAAYKSGDSAVHVYVNLYRAQRQGRELVQYRNSVLGAGWSETGSMLPSQLEAGSASEQPRIVRDESGREWVLVSLYNVDGALTTSALVAQLEYGARALLRPVPSGVIALASPCNDDCRSAAGALQMFWRQAGARFIGMLHAED